MPTVRIPHEYQLPAWRREWLEVLGKRCRQRILIVTDTGSSTDAGSPIGLTELLRVLQGNGEVPLAMPTDVNLVSTATGFSFATASPPVTVANYDQVWLFGFTTGAPGPGGQAQQVLETFMAAGGGLFATGDHSDIGAPLSGALPRVRAMREWSAVPMAGPDRIDTINHPGDDGVTHSSDQSDHHPQTMYPLLHGVGAAAVPHPLLVSPHGPINVLPDHPHESVCYAPRGAALAAGFPEFAASGGHLVGPELVAISMSASLNVDKGPVNPRCFGAISAYDGHLADVGRVVCDATWHHFVNMNLNGAGFGGTGLREGSPLQPNTAYLQIQRYYANIADWLTPQPRRWCRLLDILVAEIFQQPLWEEMLVIPWPPKKPVPPPPPPWDLLVQTGRLLETALTRRLGAGRFDRLVDELVDLAELPLQIAETLSPRRLRFEPAEKGKSLHVAGHTGDREALRLGLAGSALLRLRSSLPVEPDKLAKKFGSLHDEGAKACRDGLRADLATGFSQLQRVHELAASQLMPMAKLIPV